MSSQKQIRCRFGLAKDTLLAEEVKAKNPYGSDDKQAAWDELRAALNAIPLFHKPLDDRAMKDRVDKLLKEFTLRKNGTKLKSGKEYAYAQLDRLFTEIEEMQLNAAPTSNSTASRAQELNSASKEAGRVGEIGRAGTSSDQDGDATDDEDRNRFMHETGLPARDWEDEKEHQKTSPDPPFVEDLARWKLAEQKKNEKKFTRGSRDVKKRKCDEEEEKLVQTIKESDDRKYCLKEKQHADSLELQKRALDIEEKNQALRQMELENERERLLLKKMKMADRQARRNGYTQEKSD